MPIAQFDLRPDQKKLRQFGIATAVMASVLALIGHFRGGVLGLDWNGLGSLPGLVMLSLGGCSLVCALLWPTGLRPLYLLLTVLTFPIGFLLSHLLLALLYYGLITPVALLFRIIRRDRLNLSWQEGAKSYWTRRRPAPPVARYFRQF